MSEIKEKIDSMESALDTNDLSELFSVKSVPRYINLPHKIPLLPKFIPGKFQQKELIKLFGALSPSSLTSDKHGYSMKTTQKSPEAGSSTVKQLLDEPKMVTTIKTGYGQLYHVACLSDKEIWTSSGDGSTMKLFSINQGSLLKSIKTKSGNMPCDIAVTKSGDLLYTDYDDRTVNFVKNEKIEEVIRLQNWKPQDVCSTSSGDLLVIMDNDDYKQTKNKNLDICVSDNGSRAVVVVNQARKLRFRYNGHTPAPKYQPFSPQGITTDKETKSNADIRRKKYNVTELQQLEKRRAFLLKLKNIFQVLARLGNVGDILENMKKGYSEKQQT
ncbi:uncharacterized protein LOC134264690 [Saccostrea cucullata]|uniref:uncharacterized protein LOC134264690 n=1 Tax=Saccostrea cuccullata TaxID=36930 RepID=UPI002ED31727